MTTQVAPGALAPAVYDRRRELFAGVKLAAESGHRVATSRDTALRVGTSRCGRGQLGRMGSVNHPLVFAVLRQSREMLTFRAISRLNPETERVSAGARIPPRNSLEKGIHFGPYPGQFTGREM